MSLDQLSERYAEHNRSERGAGFVFARPEREALFRRYVGGPGRRVLDLGCRDGALTQAYAEENEVVGVDADREALAEAAKLGIETHWADLDQPLELPDESFDVVVAGELLEHLRDPQRLVADVRRVLRPGGTFVAKVFQSGAEGELLAQLKRDFATVKHVKPASSRQDSSERYVLAMGFRGGGKAREEL